MTHFALRPPLVTVVRTLFLLLMCAAALSADERRQGVSPAAAAMTLQAGGAEGADSTGGGQVDGSPEGGGQAAKKKQRAEPKPSAGDKNTGKSAASKEEVSKKDESAAGQEAEPVEAKVVRFTLRGEYPEGPTPPGLFGELRSSLSKIVRRLDAAAEDDEVAAVWLRIETPVLGRGKINELRQVIGRIREADKPVYAELTVAGPGHYLLAAACDEILMAPSGTLMLPGVRAEVAFYRGLLDKLGIQMQLVQMGKYKGASEPFTRSSMSEPVRESMTAIVDDHYDALLQTVAADRGLDRGQVEKLVDRGFFTAQAAREAGLVDELLYRDEVHEKLRKRLEADELNVVDDYKKRKVDTDFSGLGGFMKLMQLAFGGKPAEAVGKQRKIAIVYAVGPIMLGKADSTLWGQRTVDSVTLVKALKQARDDSNVVAVVLRVDSPGGSAMASDLIWRQTVKMEKPLVASMGDVAASGGYYISMGADQILAEPGTLTGSIGVVGGKAVLNGLFDKIGVNVEVISRGKNSGILSSTEAFSDGEREVYASLLQETYQQFVDKAAKGRGMQGQELEKLAQGRVYTGRMAAENGLVDRLGTLRDAVQAAKKAAGLKEDEEVELMILPRPKTVFERLFGDPSAATGVKALLPEAARTLDEVATLRQLFSEAVLLWMPFRVELK